jgi:hypothetical protein
MEDSSTVKTQEIQELRDFELLLQNPKGNVKKEDFLLFFSNKEDYSLDEDDSLVMYLNENTGVEFSLEWIDLSNEEEKADYLGITGKILLLSIPLVKSHIVAFEVTMELEELINEFEVWNSKTFLFLKLLNYQKLQVADLQEYEDNPKVLSKLLINLLLIFFFFFIF